MLVVLRCPCFGVIQFAGCLHGQMRAPTALAIEFCKCSAQLGEEQMLSVLRNLPPVAGRPDGKVSPLRREMQTAMGMLVRRLWKTLAMLHLGKRRGGDALHADEAANGLPQPLLPTRSGRVSSTRYMECNAATSASARISSSVFTNSHARLSTSGSSMHPLFYAATPVVPSRVCVARIELGLRGISASASSFMYGS
jgi:hypothetical protein